MATIAAPRTSPLAQALRDARASAEHNKILNWIAGVEALLLRAQLATPNASLLNADEYNRLFTMHGTTMVFLVVMPLSAAFFNLMVPLMIGARDVAFPRLNAFSYWTFLAGGIFLNASFFTRHIFNGQLGA